MVVLAGFTAFGGLVAMLAGAYGLRQARRIAASGLVVLALVKTPPTGATRALLQFETADGRVIEIASPVPGPLAAGGHVRVAYDPDDPREVVLLGNERAWLDRGFVGAGAMLVVLGVVLALTVG